MNKVFPSYFQIITYSNRNKLLQQGATRSQKNKIDQLQIPQNNDT